MVRIAGLVTGLPPDRAKAQLNSMLKSMEHEPFHSSRELAIPELGCYLGLVSMGAPVDGELVIDKTRARVVAFAGEHFGSTPRESAADVLARFEREGERCLLDLNGWFAGAMVDLNKSTIL